MAIDASAEIRERTVLRDLVALSTIPAAWVGRDPPAVAAGLAETLVGLLGLDFAYVRLSDPSGEGAVEVTRGDAWKRFPQWLDGHPPPRRCWRAISQTSAGATRHAGAWSFPSVSMPMAAWLLC